MDITIQAKTYAECNGFLSLIYNGREYNLHDFSSEFKTDDFSLDHLLPKCDIVYRGKRMTYEEYVDQQRSISAQLKFFTRYREEIMPIEIGLAISNKEYYRATKFLEKAENCLQTARYYFYRSTNIMEYDCCINWKSGYQGIYDLRSRNFQTAIIWYNNCFDYIVQIAFLAFGLYKEVRRYTDDMNFEEILKLCTYNTLKTLHENNPANSGLTNLWNIIETCRVARQDLNDWANYAKHKGGIGFVGLKPDTPVQIYIGSTTGGYESRISEFESITLDMDTSVNKVISAHEALIRCLNDLTDFIDFPAALFTINEEGRYVFPKKITYSKVIL